MNNSMSQQQIDELAEAIARNINLNEAIHEAMKSFLSGTDVDDESDDYRDIFSAVEYELINNLKGRF